MKVEKQKISLPVKQFEFEGGCLKKKKKHGKLLPNNIRALLVGPSNCGKTNLMLSLITDPNGLRFENVYLFSKSSDQPKYEFLGKVLDLVKGVEYFRLDNKFLKTQDVKLNSVCVFDDVITEKQGPIEDFFSMGRHRGIDSFYLGQTYSRIPKQLIRDNANFIVLFKMDEGNLRHAYNDHAAADMPYNTFRDICNECWKEPHGFIVIDKNCSKNDGGYRRGLDSYIKL